MAQTGSRRGAAQNTSLILAVVAFVAIGGLIWWLNVTAEPTTTAVVPQQEEEEPISDVPIVDLGSVRAETGEYVGLEVELRNQNVSSTLGGQAFWIGAQDQPFLVKMDSTVTASQPATGDTVDVRGIILQMSDSVLDAWEGQGAIAGSGDRAVASFAEVFLEASSVRARSGGGESGAEGDGQDAGGGEG